MSRVGVGDRLASCSGAGATRYHVIGPKADEATVAPKPGDVIAAGERALRPRGGGERPQAVARSSPPLPTSTSTTPSARPIARTRRRWAWPPTCRPSPASSWRRRSTTSSASSATRTRPVAAIIGGAKISTKIAVLRNLLSRSTCSSSAAAWPTPSSRRRALASAQSLVEDDQLETARDIMQQAEQPACRLLLPSTWWSPIAFAADAERETVPARRSPGRHAHHGRRAGQRGIRSGEAIDGLQDGRSGTARSAWPSTRASPSGSLGDRTRPGRARRHHDHRRRRDGSPHQGGRASGPLRPHLDRRWRIA